MDPGWAPWLLLFVSVAAATAVGGLLLLDAVRCALWRRQERRAGCPEPDIYELATADVAKLVDQTADIYTLLEEIAAAMNRAAEALEKRADDEAPTCRSFRSIG
jgi:hypothetical protein